METTTQMILTQESTIKEVKAFLRERWEEGTTCPCCQQHVQLYARPITSAMAFALILFYKNTIEHPDNTWTHVETMLKEADCPSSIRGDFSKLKYWWLIQPNEDSEGFYKITTKGVDFVLGKRKVVSHVMLYNNKAYGLKGKMVSIKECLKKRFNYESLMNGTL